MDMSIAAVQARELRPAQAELDHRKALAIIAVALRYGAYRPECYPPDPETAIGEARTLVGYARVVTRMGLAGREIGRGVSTAILEVFEQDYWPAPRRDYSGMRG